MSLLQRLTESISDLLQMSKPVKVNSAVAEEKTYVSRQFASHFDSKYPEYLQNDYKDYIDKQYPNYVGQRYDYVDPHDYPAKDRPQYGLALSGGGIRSASFGIGVIQALNNEGLVDEGRPTIFDKLSYLSTVSGGGYAGSALTWFKKKWGVFPFGELGSYSGSKESKEKSNRILSYIRLHGKYLTPPSLPTASLVGSVLGSAIHSLVAYTLILSVLMYGLVTLVNTTFIESLLGLQKEAIPIYDVAIQKIQQLVPVSNALAFEPHRVNFSLFFLNFLLLSILLFFITPLLYGASSFLTRFFSLNYGYRISVQRALGLLISFGFLCLVFTLLPLQVVVLAGTSMELSDPAFWGSGGAGLGAVIMSILEFRKRITATQKDKPSPFLAEAARTFMVALFIFFILTATYILGETLYDLSLQAEIRHPYGIHPNTYAIAALLFAVLVNINLISPHKMYRDRLMDTFLRDPEIDPYAPLNLKGRAANETLLAELENGSNWSPYHLINTNLILNNSANQQYNSRLGDNFLLSAKYCGSDATGYVPTEKFALGTMTLATAMSISGAAANPHAGVGGKGNSTSPLVSFLMTFFGFRLGYWANNPASIIGRLKPFMRPNYIFPGAGSLFNFGHTEHSPYIELSDGGHFDNSGIYELIRRRMPIIIMSDGSADLDFTLEDIGNALARVRIDFGVDIRFNKPGYTLSSLVPGSQKFCDDSNPAHKLADEKYQLSERGYAIADIVYPSSNHGPGFIGTFVYIKACMIRGLPGDIYAYKSDNPEFPNQPTSDQFFDERQFESYRELGYQITKRFLLDSQAMKLLP